MSSTPAPRSEVRSYLRKLVILMVLGVVLMATTAYWAWNTYGVRLKDAPALPEGVPPMNPPRDF